MIGFICRVIRFVPVVLMSSVLCGCFTYRAGTVADESDVSMSAFEWPERDPEIVRPFLEITPEQIDGVALHRPMEVKEPSNADASAEDDRSYLDWFQPVTLYTIEAAELHQTGLLRVYTDHGRDPNDWLDMIAVGFAPNAAFLTSREVEGPRFQERMAALEQDDDSEGRASPLLRRGKLTRIALTQGLDLFIQRDLPESPRGTLIYFTAMLGNDYERRVIDSLRERGWVIIGISTRSSIIPPKREEYAERIAELEEQSNHLFNSAHEAISSLLGSNIPYSEYAEALKAHEDYQESRRLRTEWRQLKRGSFQLCDESDIDHVAEQIGEQIDDLLAEHAYAAEAALAYLHEQHLQLRERPTAIIGFSAGSLAAPTAAIRLIDEIDAVVLIGAGANFLRIVRDSSRVDGGLRVQCGDDPAPDHLMSQLEARYLERTQFDPYTIAPHLRHKPMLLVTATFDAWVPPSSARLLRERLGSPSRLTHFGGHGTLFYFVPGQADRIARWLDEATEITR